MQRKHMTSAPTPAPKMRGSEPVVWVSRKQLPHNPEHAYIACRLQAEGNFDTPLYAIASPDEESLWRFWNEKARTLATEIARMKADRLYVAGCNEGFDAAIELAANLITEFVIMDTSDGKVLVNRQDGNQDGLHYAKAIRALVTNHGSKSDLHPEYVSSMGAGLLDTVKEFAHWHHLNEMTLASGGVPSDSEIDIEATAWNKIKSALAVKEGE